jgi:hypothetical protein
MNIDAEELRRHLEAKDMLGKILKRGLRSMAVFGVGISTLSYFYFTRVAPNAEKTTTSTSVSKEHNLTPSLVGQEKAQELVRELREYGYETDEDK